MKDRALFKHLLSYDSSTDQRICDGTDINDYPEALAEMYYRQMRLTQSFTSWNAEKGLLWLMGFANYINQNEKLKSSKYIGRTFTFGEIIDVDFFGGFTNELTYDHPAIVLKDLKGGLMIAPITSNKTTYQNADNEPLRIKLSKNAIPFGYMAKNSTIKLDQTRYISKARVLELRQRERIHHKTGVKKNIPQKVSDTVKKNEIKEALMYLFSASLVNDMKHESNQLTQERDNLQVRTDTLLSKVDILEERINALEAEKLTITKINEGLEVKNKELLERIELSTNKNK